MENWVGNLQKHVKRLRSSNQGTIKLPYFYHEEQEEHRRGQTIMRHHSIYVNSLMYLLPSQKI